MKNIFNKSFFDRSLNRIYTKIMIVVREKKFFLSGYGAPLKYLYFGKKNSDTLVIGFQACNPKDARYNYVKTLNDVNAGRLYIKDDFSEDGKGSYYLGKQKNYDVEAMTFALIDEYIDKLKPKKLIFMGSSKGGYAALNFGLRYRDARIVIAAPQYRLGTYLNCDRYASALTDIIGKDRDVEKIEELNVRLGDVIKADKLSDTQRVYIHYSDSEHTYKEHIEDLLEDMKSAGLYVSEDVGHYTVHEDLRYYFPDYLRKTVRDLI